jgi:predicted nucleotidyltransferase/biotin operon repressor
MNLEHPPLDFAGGVRGKVLEQLLELDESVSRRELAAMLGIASGNASAVIQELIDSGLVIEERQGRSSMVTINRLHLSVELLVQIQKTKDVLIQRLKTRFLKIESVSHAWLFGSVVRGNSHRKSDIDILIISKNLDDPVLHQKLSTLDADVRNWTGNEIQFVEHTPDSWKQVALSQNRLVQQIQKDGICLKGPLLNFAGKRRDSKE